MKLFCEFLVVFKPILWFTPVSNVREFNIELSPKCNVAQSAGAVEYTNCVSVEGQDFSNDSLGYDTKQSESEVPVMLELWGIQSTLLLPLLPGPLWPGVVAPDRILSMGQIELNCVLMLN